MQGLLYLIFSYLARLVQRSLNVNYNRSSVETPIKNVSAHRKLSAVDDSVPYAFTGKKVTKAPAGNSIIQEKIEKLIRGKRRYNIHMRSETPIREHLNLSAINESGEDFSDVAVLMYMSEGPECNFNGRAYLNGEFVTCRNLVYWWLNLKEFKYDDISSKELIEKCLNMPSDSLIDKQLFFKVCPAEGIYFEMHQIHEAIFCATETLTEGQEKRYYISSSGHAMGLCIRKNKDNNIIIYYYDPNRTLRHKKMIINTQDDLNLLTCGDFWNSTDKKHYFKTWFKVSCLLSIDVKLSPAECKVVCLSNPSKSLMTLMARRGHYEHSENLFNFEHFSKNTKKQFLAGKDRFGRPALREAYYSGHYESVATLCLMIINSDLEPDAKKELLQGKSRNKNCSSVLHLACELGNTEAVAAFIDAMDRSDVKFNNADKKKYLSEKDQDYKSPSDIAFMYGHFGIYKMLIDAIHKSCFWNLWASTLSHIYSHYR